MCFWAEELFVRCCAVCRCSGKNNGGTFDRGPNEIFDPNFGRSCTVKRSPSTYSNAKTVPWCFVNANSSCQDATPSRFNCTGLQSSEIDSCQSLVQSSIACGEQCIVAHTVWRGCSLQHNGTPSLTLPTAILLPGCKSGASHLHSGAARGEHDVRAQVSDTHFLILTKLSRVQIQRKCVEPK